MSFKEDGIQIAAEDMDFQTEMKLSRSASPTSSLELSSKRFTVVFRVVAVKNLPNVKNAEVRYHHESSPDTGTWEYLIVDSLELRNTPTKLEIESARTNLSALLEPLLRRLAKELLIPKEQSGGG